MIPQDTRFMSQRHSAPRAAEAKPGSALRALRTTRGWTLAELSQRTGLPVSTLSKIENDRMSLSYDKLTRLCSALEVDIAELFAAEAAAAMPVLVSGRRSITRAGQGRRIDTHNFQHLYHAQDLLNKRFVPIVAELHAHSLADFGELVRHAGEEYAYVLEGVVEVHTEHYAPVRLAVGDSIYFDSGMAHAYIAAAPGRCRVLAICSTSESQLVEMARKLRKPPAPEAPKQASKATRKRTVKRKGRSLAGKG
jgi:transcriptional regulator with XRE-family HTH domain